MKSASVYNLLFLFTILATGSLAARVTNPSKVPRNAVLLSKVSSLTVRAGKKTASRRVSPVPQLKCVGPANVCKLYEIDAMRCTNEGADYEAESIQWSCKASLPAEFKLGSTEVSCEGYESSEDPYVLKGSCGVEYRLFLTELGEAKYGNKNKSWDWNMQKTNPLEKYAGYAFMLVFCIVLFIILRGIFNAWRSDPARRGGRRLGGRGGGGGGGPDDDYGPPPPYDPFPPRNQSKKPSTRSYTPRSSQSSSSRTPGQQQGWRPGFWTGAATGAAAGYMFGGRNQGRQAPPPERRGWNGFGGGWGRQPSAPESPSNSSSTYSSSRHESTGFGGTSRR